MNKKNSYFSNIVCVPSKSNVVKTNQTSSVKWKTFLYPIICQHNIPSLHTQNLHHISSHTTYDIPTFLAASTDPTHTPEKETHPQNFFDSVVDNRVVIFFAPQFGCCCSSYNTFSRTLYSFHHIFYTKHTVSSKPNSKLSTLVHKHSHKIVLS